MLLLAHVSDVHLDGSAVRAERARRVAAYLAALPRPVDAVLLTGDIADHGRPEEYAEARELIGALPGPVLTCPGNHDVRAAYRSGLLGRPAADGPVNEAHRVGGAVIAMCDSSVPGRPEGYLDDATLTWLDEVIGGAPEGAPVFVCFHHPPVALHSTYVDPIRQFGEERLAAVIGRHERVVALLCGHAHTPAATTFAGRPLLVAPGVVSTLRLPWERDDPLDYDLPPAIAFHVLGDDGRLTTHYRVVC